MNLAGRYPKLFLTLSGIAVGFAFVANISGLLLPLLLIPLFFIILPSKATYSLRKVLALGFVYFLAFHALVLSWFLDVELASLSAMSSPVATFMAVFSICVMSIVLSICMTPLSWALYHVKSRPINNRLIVITVLAAAWVVSEWLRSIGFSVFLYGEGGSIGDYWNFGSLGLAFMETPLASASRYIGMYGLSFLCVSIAVSIYFALTRQGYLPLASCIGIACIITIAGLHFDRVNSDGEMSHASVLQSELERPDIYGENEIVNMSSHPKDLIVLAEYSGVYDPAYPVYAKEFVADRLSNEGVSLEVSDGDSERWFGTLEIRDKTGQITDTQTKELLIPTGEYLPFIITAFNDLTGQDAATRIFEKDRRVYKGEPPKVIRTANLAIGPVACSGILGRNIFRSLSSDGAEVLTNSASLLVFNNSKTYFKQSLQMARFHAVANNRPFIQSSAGASSYAFDSDGRFIVFPEGTDSKFVDFTFQPKSKKTPYTIFGEWVLVLALSITVLFSLNIVLSNRRKH